jgi:hypothetical protein
MTFHVLCSFALGRLLWIWKTPSIAWPKYKYTYKLKFGNLPTHVASMNQFDLFASGTHFLVIFNILGSFAIGYSFWSWKTSPVAWPKLVRLRICSMILNLLTHPFGLMSLHLFAFNAFPLFRVFKWGTAFNRLWYGRKSEKYKLTSQETEYLLRSIDDNIEIRIRLAGCVNHHWTPTWLGDVLTSGLFDFNLRDCCFACDGRRVWHFGF